MLRKSRLRAVTLEALEPRTLLSTLPPITTNPAANYGIGAVTGPTNGNQVDPSVAIDPLDPTKMVAVWVMDDPSTPLTSYNGGSVTQYVEAAYSTDSGKTWTGLNGSFGNNVPDPSVATNPPPLPNVTDASVAFDANNNFYLSDEAHRADFSVGQLTTERFSFAGGTPAQTLTDNAVKQWTNISGAVFKPILAADGNRTTANGQTDPATSFSPINGGTFGAVYITLQTSQDTTSPVFQSSTVQVLTSIDGAQNFAAATLSQQGNGSSGEEASAPSIAISQGNTSGTVKAGQATVVWDDSGTNPNNNDVIRSNTVNWDTSNHGASTSPNAPINSPPSPTAANTTITPVVNTYPLTINGAPNSFSLVNLTASVNLSTNDGTNSGLGGISIQLVSPTGQSIFLLKNAETQSATSANNVVTVTTTSVNPAQGAATPDPGNLATTFNDDAAQSIKGSQGTAATYRAEGNVANAVGQTLSGIFGGLNASQVNGSWKLVVTSYLSGASGTVNSFGLSITGTVLGGEKQVVTLNPNGGIRGSTNAAFFSDLGSMLAMPNRGIEPAPVIVSDNTLGANSAHEGRIYLAYVDRYNTTQVPNNPADNTDIFLLASDDGGSTWFNPSTGNSANTTSGAEQVNDDDAQTDGFSESDRSQFEPSVAVDPANGMLGISFFDARNDAARARVATYVGVSIDGGASFSPETYVNTPQQAIDEATNAIVTLGPIPDNQSTASGIGDTIFNFGDHQALIMYDGAVMPVWASNMNGARNNSAGNPLETVNLRNGLPATTSLLQITIAHATAPVGPRVIAVTQGPVGVSGDTLNPNPSSTSGPTFGKFKVTFDRPIDVTSFVPADVQVLNDGTTDAKAVYTGGYTITPQNSSGGFASVFLVTLNAPQTAVGAYSIAIAPASATDIRTDVQYYKGATLVTAEPMDQDTNPAHAGLATNVFPTSNLAADALPGSTVSLPIIVPGPHIVSTSVAGGTGSDNEVLNGTVSAIDITFDRNMNSATLVGQSNVVLRVMGPAGLISDKFTITQPNPNDATTYQINFLNPTTNLPDPQTLNGTYTVTLASTVKDTLGNALDTNLNAGLYEAQGDNPYGTNVSVNYVASLPSGGAPIPDPNASIPDTLLVPITVPDTFLVQGVSVNLTINYPYDPNLTATLLAPGAVLNADGTISGPSARLFSNDGSNGSAANFTNTTFVSSTNPGVTAISAGGAPFLNGTFDALDPFAPFQGIQANGTWYLYIQDAQIKPDAGTLQSLTLTLQKNVSAASTGLGEPVADQATVSFRIFNDLPTNVQSTNTWTSAGPSGIDGSSRSGRVGALAVDPSDPSGNTVYVGGASGGIWKTTDFLTANPAGPTWIPLTDFGPTSDNNIGGLAVFGVNNDPNQSIIFAATGEGDTGSSGKGFLRSLDGGATWQYLDSTNNTPGATHDHLFANDGTTAFKIIVDPKLNVNGDVIVYAALSGSGPTSGIWRSLDSGLTWQRMRAGNATDVTLDPLSGTGSPGGNLQIVYGAFGGDGVYMSTNQGSSWNLMLGTTGDPLIQDATSKKADPVVTTATPPGTSTGATPNGPTKTRIQLAKPFLTGVASEDLIYEGYLYALVSDGDSYDGLYLTKDNGANWTKVRIATAANAGEGPFNPTNNTNDPDYDPLGGQGSYNLSLAIDPTNPNVVYIGGSSNPPGNSTTFGAGFLRVDTTGILDAHNATPFSGSQPDSGQIQKNTVGGVSPQTNTNGFSPLGSGNLPYLNLIRNPANFFSASSVFFTKNIAQFNNNGADATWIPFGDALAGSTDQHKLLTIVDPLTGKARLIIGDDQGVFTGVDDNGAYLESNLGTANVPFGSRDGNLVLTQFYYGSAQPSAHTTNGTVRDVTLYGGAQDTGGSQSSGLLTTGNVAWSSGATGGGGDYMGVATDQTGSGTVYRFLAPADGFPSPSAFFQINGTDYVNGLDSMAGDPQTEWGYGPVGEGPDLVVGLFQVNPINGNQIIISSSQGTVYRTEDQGLDWFPLGTPSQLDGSYAPALAFGAPAPGSSNQDNFIYAGTVDGNIFRYYTGSGSSGNPWTNISSGLAGAGTIRQIIPDPSPGTADAYAVAQNGVFYTANALAANPTWTNISGNLFSLLTPTTGNVVTAVGDTPTSVTQTKQLSYLSSIQVDWRYVLPNQPGNASAGTHPVVYVGGDSGVYRSLDNGTTWTDFPNTDPQIDAAPVNGGYLPHVPITSMTLSDGNIDPTTGRATISTANGVTDPSLLSLSTYGQGSFFIQLAPIILPDATSTQPTYLGLDPNTPNNLAGTTTSGLEYTSNTTQVFTGISEQSAFGNVVNVQAYDETPGSANFGKPIPGATAATDANGNFRLTVTNYFTLGATYTIGFQATDQSGTKGNLATFSFVVNGPPAPPTNVVLDPGSDTGTFNGDAYTADNNTPNAATNPRPAPIIDVFGIQAPINSNPTTVVLLRATETNGVVGAFTIVNQVTTTTGGEVMIADTNAGNGQIADTPVNTPIDTAPPQPNQYVYSAYQINSLGTKGPQYQPGAAVIVDTTPPAAPSGITLDPSSDTGPSSTDNYTSANNTAAHPAPVFDITGIEPHATVVLERDGVVVGTITNANPTGPKNTVQVSDLNSSYGGGAIPDSPVGNPIDTLSSANAYTYTAYQVDLAGNTSGVVKPVFGNTGAVVIDGTDADNHGDNLGPGGTNETGWLYMQKVLNLIQPNITNGNKVLVALGTDPSLSGSDYGAAESINSAFLQSNLPGLGWSIEFITGAANIGTYLSGQNTPSLNISNGAIPGGISIAQTGFLYISTDGHAAGDLTNPELTVVNAHGPDIANYVNGGGGLFAEAESPATYGTGGGNPPAFGWLSAVFPGLIATEDGTQSPNGYQITPAGAQIFPTLTTADVAAGPWHGYFGGNLGALTVVMTAQDSTNVTRDLILTTAGTTNASASALGVVIDTQAPVTPSLTLDAGSVTGGIANNTQDNNGKYPAPTFDVTNVEPNATVNLYRVTLVNGVPTGSPVLVNSVVEPATAAPSTVTIQDVNAGGGTIPNGTYQYTVTQADLAGNLSTITNASTVTITINAGLPNPPTNLILDPASDTGAPNDAGNLTTRDNNSTTYPAPQFDVGALTPGYTLQLYRAPIVNGIVGTPVLVSSVVASGANGSILDTNNNAVIPDGTYSYTTKQKDLSGNISLPSNAVKVTIASKAPLANPPTAPTLEAQSDTGTFNNDRITEDNNSTKFPAPIVDAGTSSSPVQTNVTVRLYRTPANAQFVATGAAVLVDTLYSPAGGIVPIADTNGGNGAIADGYYLYTDTLTSLAGVTGQMSPATQVRIVTATPSTPAPLQLDTTSDTGVSKTDAITQVTLFAHPKFDVGPTVPVLPGATLVLYRAPVTNGVVGTAFAVTTLTDTAGGEVQIPDTSTSIPDGEYQYTIQQVDLAGNASPIGSPTTVIYDTGQPSTPPIPKLDPANPGNPSANQTSSTNPIIDVTVTPTAFETAYNLPLSVSLVRDGNVVATSPYGTTSGVIKITDPSASLSQGSHTYQTFVTDVAGNKSALSPLLSVTIGTAAAESLTLDPGSYTGPPGSNTTSVKNPTFDVFGTTAGDTLQLLRDNATVATLTKIAGGTVQITDPGPVPDGSHAYYVIQVAPNGSASPPGPELDITVNTTVPTAPVILKLDPSSDSGNKGDNITNDRNPTLDLAGVTAGDMLKLFRNGAAVPSQFLISGTSATITDTGPAPGGQNTYTVEQVNAANNASAMSNGLAVTIYAASPSAPVVSLAPGSGVGTTTSQTSPSFTVSFVTPGDTVQLFRDGTLVKSLLNAPSSSVTLQDFGPLTNGGTHVYTASQTDIAGNVSALSTPVTITVNTSQPILPAAPTGLTLAPSSDSGIKGDRITDVRLPSFTGHADPGVLINLYDGGNTPVGTATAGSDGSFTVQVGTPSGLGAPLLNGYYSFVAQAYSNGQVSGGSLPLTIKVEPAALGDFTGNGNTQPALVRQTSPTQLQWFVLNDPQINGRAFGASATDVALVGDFTGIGRMDLMLFTPSTGTWTIESPTTNYTPKVYLANFGAPPANAPAGHPDYFIPVPADYNGNGTESAAVYQTNTGQWFINGRAAIAPITNFQAGDIPVPGDYDNTGKAELALYRPSTATWFIQGSPVNPTAYGVHVVSPTLYTVSFGGNGDIPVPASYFANASDHSVDIAVWRPSLDEYLIRTPAGGTEFASFAVKGVVQTGDIPAPGDYSGTGVTQPAIYRPSTPGFFTATISTTPAGSTSQALSPFGGSNFVPLLSPYSYRALKSGGGTISAFSVSVSNSDFAASAVSLSTVKPATATATSSTSTTSSTPAVVQLRIRPAQAVAPQSTSVTPVDAALAALGEIGYRRLVKGLL